MNKIKLHLGMIGVLTALAVATNVYAQQIPGQQPDQQQPGEKQPGKQKPGERPGEKPSQKEAQKQPFHGKVEKIDQKEKTLTVDKKLIYVTEATKLTKTGKAIKLSEIREGEEVHGMTRMTTDGKTEALTVKVGPQEKEQKPGEQKPPERRPPAEKKY